MKFIKVAGFVSTIALLAAISSVSVQAQTANSQSGATSSSGAASQSSSGAISTSRGGAGGAATSNANQGVASTTNTGVTLNQSSTSSPNTSANNTDRVTYGGGTNNSTYNRNDGDVTVRTTPTVYAPPVSGGNPCTLAVSGGVSVIGWGAAAGGTFVDQDCATRQKIAMVHNAGYAKVAFEMMCNDRATYDAAKTAGQACAYRPQFEAPGAPVQQPMVQQQPTVVTPAPQPMVSAPKQYQRCNPRAGIVDNCVSG